MFVSISSTLFNTEWNQFILFKKKKSDRTKHHIMTDIPKTIIIIGDEIENLLKLVGHLNNMVKCIDNWLQIKGKLVLGVFHTKILNSLN